MKKLFFYALFFLSVSCFASDKLEMEILNENSEINEEEFQKLNEKRKEIINMFDMKEFDSDKFESALKKYKTGIADVNSLRGKKNKKKRKEKVNEEFSSILKIADDNLKVTQNNLTWMKNTPRMVGAGFGGFAILFGLGKGIYDFSQYWEPNTKEGANTVTLVQDLVSILTGFKIVWTEYRNDTAKSEFAKAAMMKHLVREIGDIKSSKKNEEV